MESENHFESNYENASKIIDTAYKCATQYEEIHFWEQPNGYVHICIILIINAFIVIFYVQLYSQTYI